MTFANVFLLASAIFVNVSNSGGFTTENPVPVYSVSTLVINNSTVPNGTNNKTILETYIDGSVDETSEPQRYPLMSAFVTRLPVASTRVSFSITFTWSNHLNLNANYYIFFDYDTDNVNFVDHSDQIMPYMNDEFTFVYNDTASNFHNLQFTFSLVWYQSSTNQQSYTQGYDNGVSDGYQDGYTTGKTDGYTQGYNDALNTHDFTFNNLFYAIGDTPILMIRRLFGFELFGVSLISVFMSLFTALIVIHLIKKVF